MEKTMRPIDFVVFDGDSSPNVPAYKVAEAMMLPITVRGAGGDFVILSYYMDKSGGMVLDVEPREAS